MFKRMLLLVRKIFSKGFFKSNRVRYREWEIFKHFLQHEINYKKIGTNSKKQNKVCALITFHELLKEKIF